MIYWASSSWEKSNCCCCCGFNKVGAAAAIWRRLVLARVSMGCRRCLVCGQKRHFSTGGSMVGWQGKGLRCSSNINEPRSLLVLSKTVGGPRNCYGNIFLGYKSWTYFVFRLNFWWLGKEYFDLLEIKIDLQRESCLKISGLYEKLVQSANTIWEHFDNLSWHLL